MAYDAIIRWENEGGAVPADPAVREDPSAAEARTDTKRPSAGRASDIQETTADSGAPVDRAQRLEREVAF